MFIIYSGEGGRYASAAVSKRKGKKTYMETIYLGKVIDREAGIYQSKERGMFTFDPATGIFGEVPEDFVLPRKEPLKEHKRISVDFGDAYFLDQYLWKSGMMEAVDSLGYDNPDTLHAMLQFYTLSYMNNSYAEDWYHASFAQLLYPEADMSMDGIRKLLAAIGTPEKKAAFLTAYIDCVLRHLDSDEILLTDSGEEYFTLLLPPSVPLIHTHEGVLTDEVRIILTAQRNTGLPLFYCLIPKNMPDGPALEHILSRMDSFGTPVDSCFLNPGYVSSENLALFYNEDHSCKIDFMIRVNPLAEVFKEIIFKEAPVMQRDSRNIVKYDGVHPAFVTKKRIMVGSNKDNPAWFYVILDRGAPSFALPGLREGPVKIIHSIEDIYDAIVENELFGIVTSQEYDCQEIITAFLQRQEKDPFGEFVRKFDRIWSMRTNISEIFEGHLLLSFAAACLERMIEIQKKAAHIDDCSVLGLMHSQNGTIYQNRIRIDEAQERVEKMYELFGISCPSSIPIADGRLCYKHPDPSAFSPRKGKEARKAAKKKEETADSGTDKTHHETDSPGNLPGTNTGQESKKDDPGVSPRRGRGRPRGSRNRKTAETKEAGQDGK